MFAESGYNSKAWWLSKVKNWGSEGMNSISLGTINDRVQTEKMVQNLIDTGHVKQFGKMESGTLKYELTSFGHRYLEEHKSEVDHKSVVSQEEYEKKQESGTPVYTKYVNKYGISRYYKNGRMCKTADVPALEKDRLDREVPTPPKGSSLPIANSDLIHKQYDVGEAPKIVSPFGPVKREVEKEPIVPGKPIQPMPTIESNIDDDPLGFRKNPPVSPAVPELEPGTLGLADIDLSPRPTIFIDWCTVCLEFKSHEQGAFYPKCESEGHTYTTRPDRYYSEKALENHECKPETPAAAAPGHNPGTLTLEPQAIGPFIEGTVENGVRNVVSTILIEKFADQVSAKEILERLSNK